MTALQSSAEQLITDNIDIWTSAIKKRGSQGRGSSKKIELYGIKKLRELILELAVCGLLVPQDPNEEPASVLLRKVAAKKAQLIADGKIKKQKPLPEISEEENTFNLPAGWACARLGSVMNVLNGRAYKKHEMLQTGTPLLRVGNLFTSKEWYYSDLELGPEKYIDTGDLIYAWSASFGPFIWDAGKVIYHYHIWKLDLYHKPSFDKYYLLNYLQSITASIKASGNGIAMIHMTKERMEKLILPIAPLNEQSRIVAKVNELMVLCDQLEQQTETSLTAHQTLVENLLNTLLNAAQSNTITDSDHTSSASSPTNDSFDQAWNRIAEHFDVLFTTEDSIDQLKQTILQLAVMGKLVPQDPNDEPASKLLEKIAAEKEQLIKDKKIKKQKSLPPISDYEKPFELPSGWEWVRFFDVNTVKAELVPAINFPNENQIAPDSIEKGTGVLIEDRTVRESGAKGPNNKFYTGQILYSKIRPSLNKVVIAPYDGLCSADMYPIICHSNKLFMLDYMLSECFLVQVRKAENRVKMPKLNLESLGLFLTVLPPEAEQSRIANRINEFMELCEVLKSNIRTSQSTQLQLADALAVQGLNKDVHSG